MNDESTRYLVGHLVCISQWAAFILVDYVYLGKKRVRLPCLWAALMAAGMLLLSIRFHFGFFTVKSVLSNVVYLLLTVLLFGGTTTEKLTACLINGTMCLLTENTVSYTFSWITGMPTHIVWHDRTCLIWLVVANIVVGIVVAVFVRRWNTRRALEPLQALVMSFFPGVVVGLNIVLMISHEDNTATLLNLLLTMGLTVAVLVHLAIVQMFNEQVVQREDSRYRAGLERQRAEALLDSYTAQRRLTHEFTNHIDALSALLEQGDVQSAQEYIASVNRTVVAGTTIMDTHNPLLDSILSRKYEEAEAQGVALYFDLCDLKELPLTGTDMVIVISNLLDNAIRAAAPADLPEVYVRVRKTGDEYVLSVRNRVVKDVELVNGQLPASTKTEPGHGMGLANVRDVLRKYGGEYTISCRERWFRFTFAVPTCIP